MSIPDLSIFNNRSGYRPGIEDFLFEKLNRLNLETIVKQEILKTSVKSNLKHATYYQPITCRNLKLILQEAQKTRISFDHFIDIGAGKGKACFYAARNFKCRKIIGVDFSLGLTKIANRNKTIFAQRNITFLNDDAAYFILPSGRNLVFLFNPFDDVILERFIANISSRMNLSSPMPMTFIARPCSSTGFGPSSGRRRGNCPYINSARISESRGEAFISGGSHPHLPASSAWGNLA